MHFAYTDDLELVTSLLTNPRAYAVMRHDALPPAEEFRVAPIKGVRWVVAWVKSGAEPADVPVAAVMVCRDRQLVQQRFLGWFWRLHKGCREIRAAVPSHNRLTLKLARNCGFRHVSATPNVGTRHGEPFDLHLFRMTRPEVFA
jgi:hypothetical protein